MSLFCLLDPGQIRYRAIYTHPNQIPGYASAVYISMRACMCEHKLAQITTRFLVPQIVDFLNDLYSCFDDIISKHDVYKVGALRFVLPCFKLPSVKMFKETPAKELTETD